jgi:2-iminobutanoate/2-iminopropanoate deaminase
MDNLILVLSGLNLGLEDVVSVRIYITEFKRDYYAMNETYKSYFPADRLPSGTCIGVTALAVDALVEIDLIALKKEKQSNEIAAANDINP